MVEHNKSTIVVRKETRLLLTKIGRKKQTYDQIIRELINSKNNLNSLESKTPNLHLTSESTNP